MAYWVNAEYFDMKPAPIPMLTYLNSSPPGQNGRHYGRRHFQRHFHEWKLYISIRISLKFVPKGPIDNKSALVRVMAWRRTGDKPLPEPMLTQFTDAYMRGTRGRWVNLDAYVIICINLSVTRFELHVQEK